MELENARPHSPLPFFSPSSCRNNNNNNNNNTKNNNNINSIKNVRYVQKLFRTAAEKGEKEKLEYLIQLKGITFFKDDWKALHYASILPSMDCLEYLISIGFNVNQPSYNNENTFLKAIKSMKCSLNLLQYLHSIGVDIHQKNDQNNNAFLFAIKWEKCPREIIEYIVGLGIDIHCTTNIGCNAFLLACHYSDRPIESYQYLDSLGIDVHCVDHMNSNALLAYLNSPHPSLHILKYLVSLGINIHQVNCDGDNLFLCAVRRGEMEMIEYVVSLGVNTQHLMGRPIFYALHHLNVHLFKYLFDHHIDRLDNYSMLHSLISNLNYNENHFYSINKIDRFKETFDYFLSLGEDINTPDRSQTPIQKIHHIDDENFLFQLVKYMIDKGSDIFHRSEMGSILHTLLRNERNINVVKYVIIRSLDINPTSLLSVTVDHISNEERKNIQKKKGENYPWKKKKLLSESEEWKKNFYKLVIDKIPPLFKIKNNQCLRVYDPDFLLLLHPRSRSFVNSIIKKTSV